jgi:EAL domain-containing protein (putative c-di-GMP-specific phosphodiesterase class I)/DNA-binding response OmpR family regulator
VFLSGESSEDLQFDAIDAGGDDFLSKPIRPRHLISAVQTRVRRHRQQESRRVKRPEKDAATGLVYRKTLVEQLEACLAAGQQTGGLVFLEVENLGLLRERIGLTALEILLGDVSRLLTSAAGELPATRFGDGSYLLLDRESEELALDSLATQLRATLMQNPFQALGHPLRLRLSVGVCAFKHGFADSGAMINAVEKVAREARTHERGVRRFEPPRATEALKEAALLSQVRDAIDQDSLVLLYQPVVAVAGSDVSQYQVLLRLRDGSGKLRSAAEIIPMAERTSLIIEIDRWVMMQALALIKERAAEDQHLRLFVTQSPLTLAAPGQAEWLRNEIASNGVPGECLVIELRLEDVAVHSATVRQFCEAMQPYRVQFCLSQLEAGADAEALIDQLPLAFVKLARKYTTGSLSPALRDEVKGLIQRAHARRLLVIGHGVEDAQSAATLWMSGIDFIQGNLVQQADQDMNFDFNQAVL